MWSWANARPGSFTNSRGDYLFMVVITCRLYFDANRKYPMIVNYYGGCSPVSR